MAAADARRVKKERERVEERGRRERIVVVEGECGDGTRQADIQEIRVLVAIKVSKEPALNDWSWRFSLTFRCLLNWIGKAV